MSIKAQALIRVELHVHTRYSKDSLVDPEKLLAHCEKIGIDRIAITDHNEMEGAFATHALAPERVIVGEEIQTTEGELLGYFMQERVPPGLPPQEAIRRLRAQGAVISVAHPFDTVRSQHWDREVLAALAPEIDAVEVFNARCLGDGPNEIAAQFAREHHLLATVGSDAHSLLEVGRASLRMPAFAGAEDFKAALSAAQVEAHLSLALVHLFSRYAVFVKTLKAKKDRTS